MRNALSITLASLLLATSAIGTGAAAEPRHSRFEKQDLFVQDYCSNHRDNSCHDWRRNRNSWDEAHYQGWYRDHYRHRDFQADNAVAGLFGFAAGMIAGSVANGGGTHVADCEDSLPVLRPPVGHLSRLRRHATRLHALAARKPPTRRREERSDTAGSLSLLRPQLEWDHALQISNIHRARLHLRHFLAHDLKDPSGYVVICFLGVIGLRCSRSSSSRTTGPLRRRDRFPDPRPWMTETIVPSGPLEISTRASSWWANAVDDTRPQTGGRRLTVLAETPDTVIGYRETPI